MLCGKYYERFCVGIGGGSWNRLGGGPSVFDPVASPLTDRPARAASHPARRNELPVAVRALRGVRTKALAMKRQRRLRARIADEHPRNRGGLGDVDGGLDPRDQQVGPHGAPQIESFG